MHGPHVVKLRPFKEKLLLTITHRSRIYTTCYWQILCDVLFESICQSSLLCMSCLWFICLMWKWMWETMIVSCKRHRKQWHEKLVFCSRIFSSVVTAVISFRWWKRKWRGRGGVLPQRWERSDGESCCCTDQQKAEQRTGQETLMDALSQTR